MKHNRSKCQILHLGQSNLGADLLSLVASDRTGGDGMNLHQGKFSMDMRKRLFTEGVVSHWKRLPREVVVASSLSEFKEHLDDALSHLVYFEVVLLGGGSWTQWS